MNLPNQELKPLPIAQSVQSGNRTLLQDLIESAYKFCDEKGRQTYPCNPEKFPRQETDSDARAALIMTKSLSVTASNVTTSTITF